MMANFTDQSVNDISVSGPGAVVSQANTRNASIEHTKNIVTGIGDATEIAGNEMDSSSLKELQGSLNTLAAAAQQKGWSKSEGGLRTEVALKDFVSQNPHLTKEARAMARSTVGFDPTGTMTQLQFGNFALGAEEKERQRIEGIVRHYNAGIGAGEHKTAEDVEFYFARKEITEAELAGINALKAKDKISNTNYGDQTALSVGPSWALQTLGSTVGDKSLTLEDKLFKAQVAFENDINAFADTSRASNNKDGKTGGTNVEAVDAYRARMKVQLVIVENGIKSADQTARDIADVNATQASLARMSSNTPVGRTLLYLKAHGGDMAVNSALAILMTSGKKSKEFKNLAALAGVDELLPGGELLQPSAEESSQADLSAAAKLIMGTLMDPQDALPNDKNEVASQANFAKESANYGRVNRDKEVDSYEISSRNESTAHEQDRLYFSLEPYSTAGSWTGLVGNNEKSAKLLKEGLGSHLGARLPRERAEIRQWFSENSDYELVWNQDKQRVDVKTTRPLTKSSLGGNILATVQTTESREAQDQANKVNALGNFVMKGGNWRWLNLPENQKGNSGMNFYTDMISTVNEARSSGATTSRMSPGDIVGAGVSALGDAAVSAAAVPGKAIRELTETTIHYAPAMQLKRGIERLLDSLERGKTTERVNADGNFEYVNSSGEVIFTADPEGKPVSGDPSAVQL